MHGIVADERQNIGYKPRKLNDFEKQIEERWRTPAQYEVSAIVDAWVRTAAARTSKTEMEIDRILHQINGDDHGELRSMQRREYSPHAVVNELRAMLEKEGLSPDPVQ